MAIITSVQSGDWSVTSTWDTGTVPVNGDAVVIAEGHHVRFNVNQSGFANGLASLVINGILSFKYSFNSFLKMNGNITGTGRLYVGYYYQWPSDMGAIVEGFGNTYSMAKNILLKYLAFERPDGTPYIEVDSIEEVDNTPYSCFVDGAIVYYNYNNELPAYVVPINRPTVGEESRVQLLFNDTGTINVPIIRMYGWYPSLEWTQLDDDAESNDNIIILKEDMGFQAEDKIAIGCGTVNDSLHIVAETTAKGVYTVSSYDSVTKTVTLNGGLQLARLTNDYVCTVSRPIKITRTSGTNSLIKAKVDNVIIKGVYINFPFIQSSAPVSNVSKNALAEHCTSADKVLFVNMINPKIVNSTRVGGGSSQFMNAINGEINDSICISGSYLSYGNNVKISNCVQQNTIMPTNGGIIKDSIFKNFLCTSLNAPAKYINCLFDGFDYDESTFRYIDALNLQKVEYYDCIFKDNSTGYFKQTEAVLYNCIFEGETEINDYKWESRLPSRIIESFNHNQIPRNYKAWCKGGRIETENSKLKFICESADYPVFRDYPILAPSNRTIKFLIGLTKDTPGITTKLQIIDPANDPLIDSTATPLAESTAQNSTEAQQIGVAYKSTTPKQLILRILCQNSSGEVLVDTTRIDQSLAKKITSLN